MANIKQQIKRARTNDKAKAANAARKTRLKNVLKQAHVAIESGKESSIKEQVSLAFKTLDSAQASGIVHKNYVARQKSKLAILSNK